MSYESPGQRAARQREYLRRPVRPLPERAAHAAGVEENQRGAGCVEFEARSRFVQVGHGGTMKTYHEALMTSAAKKTDQVAVARALALASKYDGLADEIAGDRYTHSMIRDIMARHGFHRSCDCDACKIARELTLFAFIQGVRIGIEMERQELPEPK